MLSLALSACLVAVGTHRTGAYFTDTKSGAMTGTYAVPEPPVPALPYRLDAGASKALHQGCGNDHSGHEEPIAQRDSTGRLFLDFGDTNAGGGSTRPDVLRLISLIDDSRAVNFRVTGTMAAFITEVELDNGRTSVLEGHSTERVRFRVRVPDNAAPGTYTGRLNIHVQGWTDDAEVPMTITVQRDKSDDDHGKGHDAPYEIDLSDGPNDGSDIGSSDGSTDASKDASTDLQAHGTDEPALPVEDLVPPSVETSPAPLPVLPSEIESGTIDPSITPTPTLDPTRIEADRDSDDQSN